MHQINYISTQKFPREFNAQPFWVFNSRLVGQKFAVESLNEIGTILTQHGAGRGPRPAEVSIKVQGAEESLSGLVTLLPLICGHRGTENGGQQLLPLGLLLVHVPHVDGALVEHSVLQISRHGTEALRQIRVVVCARREITILFIW